jgi:hypothetical protein
MKWLWASILVLMGQAMLAGQQAPETGAPRFEAVDVFVETTGKPLAAYQLEFFAATGNVRIAGIEGGAHPAFAIPPFYDPKAMQRERVILAAFNTAAASDLPTGRTRVATIHLETRGERRPAFQVQLEAAADPSGQTIAADVSFEERNSR